MKPHLNDRSSEQPRNTAEQPQEVSIEELALLTREDITTAGVFVLDLLTSSDAVDKTKLREAWINYADAAAAFVDSFEDSRSRAKVQIAAIINKALIFQSAHQTQRYLEELDSAEVYAANEGFEEISTVLAAEIRDKVEELDMTPDVLVLKLKGIIDDSNREYLRDLIEDGADLEEALGAAYGMILEEGDDPDAILASLGVTE